MSSQDIAQPGGLVLLPGTPADFAAILDRLIAFAR